MEYSAGRWLNGICGIGPVISAGLLSILDIRGCPTSGHWHRYAGFDPTVVWEKGKLRPWNHSLKVLCWKAGDCFVKFQNRDNDFYGRLFRIRKEYEIKKNDEGKLVEQALECSKHVGKRTKAYGFYIEGKLPPGHIHARSVRWTVKLFISHLHDFCYEDYYQKKPPKPYSFDKWPDIHRHFIEPPHVEFEPAKSLRELLTCDVCKKYHPEVEKWYFTMKGKKPGAKSKVFVEWQCPPCHSVTEKNVFKRERLETEVSGVEEVEE